MKRKPTFCAAKSFPSRTIVKGASPRLSNLILAASLIFAVGCSTGPRKFDQFDRGRFKAKILIRNKKEGKAQVVNADVRAVNGERMRVDVTSPVLTHLASLTLDGKELTMIVVPDKVGYRGKTSREALRPVLNVPIDPSLLYNVFFDQAVADKRWTCTDDEKGFIKECREVRGPLKIEWVSREREKRTVEISHPSVLLQINIYEFSKDVDLPDDKFKLNIPSSFKVYRI